MPLTRRRATSSRRADTMSDPQHHHHAREDAPPDGSDVELPAQEARQGVELGRMRYVLAGSIFAVSAIFLIIWLVIARL